MYLAGLTIQFNSGVATGAPLKKFRLGTVRPLMIGMVVGCLLTTNAFAQSKPDKPVKVDEVFTNAYSSRIKPLK